MLHLITVICTKQGVANHHTCFDICTLSLARCVTMTTLQAAAVSTWTVGSATAALGCYS
jgi:hypothetical protein